VCPLFYRGGQPVSSRGWPDACDRLADVYLRSRFARVTIAVGGEASTISASVPAQSPLPSQATSSDFIPALNVMLDGVSSGCNPSLGSTV
jgi:hypothetical protein